MYVGYSLDYNEIGGRSLISGGCSGMPVYSLLAKRVKERATRPKKIKEAFNLIGFVLNTQLTSQGLFLGTFFVFFGHYTPHLDNVTDDHRYIHGFSQIFGVSEVVSF